MDDDFDLRELVDAPVSPVPWYFRLGHFLWRHKIRGGSRLLAEARRRGLLDRLAIYAVGDVQLRVPLWRPCNQWLEDDVREYEAELIQMIAPDICAMSGAVTLVDCGADIGTISALLVATCKNIARVIAFEPNRAAFRVLDQNLAAMRVRGEARHAAVADFSGRGRLVKASQDPSAHAMYIEPCDDGPIRVERIDDLAIPAGTPCVIKIDVEGAEASVVGGARQTIRHAGELVVAFEAHPRVAQRIGRDPIEVIHALVELRPELAFAVDTTPPRSVVPDRPLFEQLPTDRVYNVIARSGAS